MISGLLTGIRIKENMDSERKKVAFYTLGCKLNFAETSTISRLFPDEEYERVPASSKADIYIINTCSVTETADRKCRQAIKKFIHRSPGAFIAVVGCYAQLNAGEISAIPGVDLVLGTNEKYDIKNYLPDIKKRDVSEIHSCALSTDDTFRNSYSAGDRTRSFLKVQDGCDYGCAYCTIPLARGNSKNPDIKVLIREAQSIAEKGIKEIVLTGVNIGDFGKSTGNSLEDLLREMIKVQGIERLRLSSIEPNLLTDEIINITAANSKILPHFHIPLQSGSDRVLSLMRRRYRKKVFSERIEMIRSKLPLSGIGADIIVGFPGETSADFEETYNFLESMPLSYLHVFTYSERPGTPAVKLPGKVHVNDKYERSKWLINLSEMKNKNFLKLNTGQKAAVLFEHTRTGGMITGFTGNYIKVEHLWQSALAGKIKNVILKDVSDNGNMTVDLID